MILAELDQLPNDLDEVTRSDLERVALSLAKLARRKAIDKSFLSVNVFSTVKGRQSFLQLRDPQ